MKIDQEMRLKLAKIGVTENEAMRLIKKLDTFSPTTLVLAKYLCEKMIDHKLKEKQK